MKVNVEALKYENQGSWVVDRTLQTKWVYCLPTTESIIIQYQAWKTGQATE